MDVLYKAQLGMCCAGTEVARLLLEVNESTRSSRPRAAIHKLLELQMAPESAVKVEISNAVFCVKELFRQAAHLPTRYIAGHLCDVSRAVKYHPELVVALKPHEKAVFELIKTCVATGQAYKDPRAVEQLSAAQARLNMCYGPFWENVRKKNIDLWDASAAKTYLQAFGSLYDAKTVPESGGRREEMLRQVIVKHVDSMDAIAVAKAMWMFGKSNIPLGSARVPLTRAAVRESDKMSGNRVADVLWGFGRRKVRLHDVEQAPLKRAVLKGVGEMSVRSLSYTLWAFATLDMRLGDVQEPLINAVVQQAGSMKAQAVTYTLWSFSKLNIDPGDAKAPLLKAVKLQLNSMNPRQVSQIMYALAKLGLELGDLEEPLRNVVAKKSQKMSDVEAANVLWAFGKLELGLEAALKPLMAAIAKDAHVMPPWGVSRSMWALAKLQVHPGDVEPLLLQAAAREAGRMGSQVVSDTVCGICDLRLDIRSVDGVRESLQSALVRESFRMSDETKRKTKIAADNLGMNVGNALDV